jgi:NAD(P)-dependent dehydrogenase (short-subunit alcohol dehydrogenase family)
MSAASLALKNVFNLSGRVALVTGGGSGIGLMIASGLAANGAKVYIASRRLELLEKVSGEWAQKGVNLHPYANPNVLSSRARLMLLLGISLAACV